MKKGFFLSFVVVILFLSLIFVALAIRLSHDYLSSVIRYKKLVFYHYACKAILKMYQQTNFDKNLESWIVMNNKKIFYVRILNNTIYLMDTQGSKAELIYYYEEN